MIVDSRTLSSKGRAIGQVAVIKIDRSKLSSSSVVVVATSVFVVTHNACKKAKTGRGRDWSL